jgi:hypothetical protein
MMEEIPKDWSKSIICLPYKKGDLMEYHNYRGLSLLNTAYKALKIFCLREFRRMQKR